jgi:hypothetical protein
MSRRLGWAATLLLVVAPSGMLSAQIVRVALAGAAATNGEVAATREAKGLGLGGSVQVDLPRVRIEARVLHAALRADFNIQSGYNVDQLDLTGSWFWRPYLALQLGAGRRFMSPEFVAQDVGLVRVGLLSETRLARLADIWVRGAYLPFTRFSGGGSASPGFELGLGAGIGSREARLQGFVEFGYQRIDRHAAADAPIQFSAGQAGVRLRL